MLSKPRRFVFLGPMTAAMPGLVPWAAMTAAIKSTPPNNAGTKVIPLRPVPYPLILPDNALTTAVILPNASKTSRAPVKKRVSAKRTARPEQWLRQLVLMMPITKNANAIPATDTTIPTNRRRLRVISRMERKENPCAGYSVCECGGEVGASTCYTGSTKKFSRCKSCDPCPGYYDCGGSWQYCTGNTCSADASKCSVYCSSDYFPNKCDNASDCNGIYRNGYCSGECDSTPYCEYTEIPFGSACSLYENNPTVGCYRSCYTLVSGEHETITLESAVRWNGETCNGYFGCTCFYENPADGNGILLSDSYPYYSNRELSSKAECEAEVGSRLSAANDFCANACVERRQWTISIYPYY